MQTDYPLEALDILLDSSCISERYYPLIPLLPLLQSGFQRFGCRKKSDAERLPDEIFRQIGLTEDKNIRLFRCFLSLYDPKPQKFRDLSDGNPDPEMLAAFRELYYLPGVRMVRATLYYLSGFRSLSDFAHADAAEILKKTKQTIEEKNLSCSVPLPKEVRTHIAVAKAFTLA